jgi:DNA-binding MurR/RpiR family transcriptional regulator
MDNAETGLPEEKIKDFKEWVKSQNKRPRVWDARRWFHEPGHSHDEQDASLDQALDLLIDEALEDAVKEMNDRNKVIIITFVFPNTLYLIWHY